MTIEELYQMLEDKQKDQILHLEIDKPARFFLSNNDPLWAMMTVARIVEGKTIREFVSSALMRKCADVSVEKREEFMRIAETIGVL